jgi:fatty-acyl-CoA synthase
MTRLEDRFHDEEEAGEMTCVQDYFSFLDESHEGPTQNQPFVSLYTQGSLESTTRNEFRNGVHLLAKELTRAGLARSDVAFIICHTSIPAIQAFFACQLIGAIPSYMPPLSPRQRRDLFLRSHHAVCDRTNPRLTILDRKSAAELGRDVLPGPTFLLADRYEISLIEHMPDPAAESCDVALLQHSSGTTGLKKGIMLTYEAVVKQIKSYATAIKLPADATVVSWLPLYHDMGLIACTILPIVAKRQLVAMSPFEWLVDPGRILTLAAEVTNPVLWLPNFAFNHLSNHAKRVSERISLAHLHAIINCSEPCKPNSMQGLIEAYRSHGLNPSVVQVCYALAENVFAATQTTIGLPVGKLCLNRAAYEQGRVEVVESIEDGAISLASCGRPIAGNAVVVRDVDGRNCAPDRIGRIWLSGDCIFGGYFRAPELTKERLVDGWFDTRDLGFMHDGELYLCGRLDDLIIVNGKNLMAHDIETACAEIHGIKPGRAIAFGRFSERTGSEGLVIAAEILEDADPAVLRNRIISRIVGEFSVFPEEVVLLPVDTLVKTTSGKIDRCGNRERYSHFYSHRDAKR